jgi:hypothetical protein
MDQCDCHSNLLQLSRCTIVIPIENVNEWGTSNTYGLM